MTLKEYIQRENLSISHVAILAQCTHNAVKRAVELNTTRSSNLKAWAAHRGVQLGKHKRGVEVINQTKSMQLTDLDMLIAHMRRKRKGQVYRHVGGRAEFEQACRNANFKISVEEERSNSYRITYNFEVVG